MRYDWHHSDDEDPHVGIHRVDESGYVDIAESDFIQLELKDFDDQETCEAVDRIEFVTLLLNEGLITERQATDIVLMKLKHQEKLK